MDKLAELSHGAKVVLGSAILLLIFSFFDWFEVGDVGVGSMWNGIGVVAGLLLIALIVWQAVRLANINLEVGVTPAMVTAFLSILLLVFVFIRWIDKPGGSLLGDVVDRTIWAWIGLILAIIIVAGAWWNMRLAGEGLDDIRSKFGGSGGGGEGSTTPPSTPTQTPPPPPPPPGDDNP
jgi:hypothetical protein